MKLSARSLAVAAALSTAGCGSSSSTFQSFLNTLETDLANGTALSDLQSVVITFFPSLTGQTQAIASVLQAAINLLIDTGVLPAGSAANANTVLVQIQGVLAPTSTPSTKSELLHTVEANRIVAEIQGNVPMSPATIMFLNTLRRTL